LLDPHAPTMSTPATQMPARLRDRTTVPPLEEARLSL
jgi:hypothetical protein